MSFRAKEDEDRTIYDVKMSLTEYDKKNLTDLLEEAIGESQNFSAQASLTKMLGFVTRSRLGRDETFNVSMSLTEYDKKLLTDLIKDDIKLSENYAAITSLEKMLGFVRDAPASSPSLP